MSAATVALTTFWPTKEQLTRLAAPHKPNAAKNGLETTTISQLHYPLSDSEREPMPAGGLFSTANDLSIFYRMIANGGAFNGKRILSEESFKQWTSKQTGDLATEYGFGIKVGKTIGHGGAYGTNSAWDPEHGLITIYLVQHAGFGPGGKDILPMFMKTAQDSFAAH
mgnify:CR=1 FL=1